MNAWDDDFHVRPGRIRGGGRGAKPPTSFVAEVMRAAKKAGHVGRTFTQSGRGKGVIVLRGAAAVRRGLGCRVHPAGASRSRRGSSAIRA